MSTYSYATLKPKIQPLDLLLLGSPGQFTHVGLVVTSELLPEVKTLKPGRHYVLETLHQKDQFGFHIRDLESLSTPFAWGHLKNNPWRLSSSLDSKEGAGFPWNPATKREGASAPWNPEKGASAPWNPATKREGASAPWNPQEFGFAQNSNAPLRARCRPNRVNFP